MTIEYTPVPEYLKPGQVRDLSGQRFGRLSVIRYVGTASGKSAWECLCDCGETTVAASNKLKGGVVVSCGCRMREVMREYPGARGFRSWPGRTPTSAVAVLYGKYKGQAKHRGLPFEIGPERFAELIALPCRYCGIEPSQVAKGFSDRASPILYNGIDRIDNGIGYTEDNCASCCGTCNMAKRNMGEEEFLAWIERAARFQGFI